MTMTAHQRAEAGRLLREAAHHVAPIDPLSTLLPSMDLADAYAVQQDNIARRLADGATVVGHKVGLTAAAMQQLLGVDEPDFGHLLDDMVHRDGGTVPAARYCRPRVESEICFASHGPCAVPASPSRTSLRPPTRSPRLWRSSTAGSATGRSPWSTRSPTTPAPPGCSAAPGHP
ncbi:hypothetical protein GCM10010317_094940 [Streptomyces mirabilis]|nr:hypothetical protein GCM10010317_094940 [Streptomyces mirabilis]